MNYIRTITLLNADGSTRRTRCYEHNGKEYRYNKLYNLYCSPDGDLLTDELTHIHKYKTKSSNGRTYWAFDRNGNKRIYLHRVIAYLFVAGYDKTLVVDHIDNNSFNNLPSNLQYITGRENTIKECGQMTIVKNIYTNEELTFGSKNLMYEYFSISPASVYYMIKEFHERQIPLNEFLPVYIEILKQHIETFAEEGKENAANNCENLIQMIQNGWILKYYQYHL